MGPKGKMRALLGSAHCPHREVPSLRTVEPLQDFFIFTKKMLIKLGFRKITWAAVKDEVEKTHRGASIAWVIETTSSWVPLLSCFSPSSN